MSLHGMQAKQIRRKKNPHEKAKTDRRSASSFSTAAIDSITFDHAMLTVQQQERRARNSGLPRTRAENQALLRNVKGACLAAPRAVTSAQATLARRRARRRPLIAKPDDGDPY